MLRMKYAFGVLLLIAFQSGALAADYANSCQFSFDKAVTDITPKCQITFYKGETTLTYQNKPIDNSADCTHDSEFGPMGGEQFDKLYMKLSNVIFTDNGAGKPRVSGSLKFNPAKNGIDTLVGLVLDGKKRGGPQFIEETGNKIFPMGPFTFDLGQSPYMRMMLGDATSVYLKGTCDGPYFAQMNMATSTPTKNASSAVAEQSKNQSQKTLQERIDHLFSDAWTHETGKRINESKCRKASTYQIYLNNKAKGVEYYDYNNDGASDIFDIKVRVGCESIERKLSPNYLAELNKEQQDLQAAIDKRAKEVRQACQDVWDRGLPKDLRVAIAKKTVSRYADIKLLEARVNSTWCFLEVDTSIRPMVVAVDQSLDIGWIE